MQFPRSEMEHAGSAPEAARGHAGRSDWRRWAWLALLPIFFVFYATSFNDFPIIDTEHSVLGHGDAAQFRLLLEDFSLGRQYGDPYATGATGGRGIEDIAQKHKIHHVVYCIVGGAISQVLQVVYSVFGLSDRQAIYSVNALIGCLNIVLLFLILRGVEQPSRPKWPFLLLYGVALGTIVNAAAPESWTFSASLVMSYLLLLRRFPERPVLLGAALGIVMLNNLFLAVLGLLVAVRMVGQTGLDWTAVRRTAIAAVLSVATWAGGLMLFSLFDPYFRPDRFIHYTLWFRDFTALGLAKTDPYVWMSAFSNLFVNSVVSNQPDPAVPQEALLHTLQNSVLGTVVTIAYAAIALVTAWAAVRHLARTFREEGWQHLLSRREVALVLWPIIMLAVTGFVHYASGFLYQAVVLPAVVALMYRYLPLDRQWGKLLFYSTLLLVIINNIDQVIQFREALALQTLR